MKFLFIFFILLFSSPLFAEDISDFEIGGMKIGDSLLDFMSKDKILEGINESKYMYEHIGDEFGEIYIFESSGKYDFFSVWIKTPKQNYITKSDYLIYSIRGVKSFDGEDIDKCYQEMLLIEKSISKEISSEVIKDVGEPFKHRIDPSGKSLVKETAFRFENGDYISIQCTDFEENLRIKNNWTEGLSVGLRTKEFYGWFRPS